MLHHCWHCVFAAVLGVQEGELVVSWHPFPHFDRGNQGRSGTRNFASLAAKPLKPPREAVFLSFWLRLTAYGSWCDEMIILVDLSLAQHWEALLHQREFLFLCRRWIPSLSIRIVYPSARTTMTWQCTAFPPTWQLFIFCGRVISARMETARCCFTSFLHENPHFLPYRNHGSNGRSGDVEGLHGDEEFYDKHITRVRRMLASLSIKRAVRSPRSLPVVGLSCPFWHPLITRICPASARWSAIQEHKAKGVTNYEAA